MKIYQHIDVFHEFDGIGNDILGIKNSFHSIGIENHIVSRKNQSPSTPNLSINEIPITTKKDIHILHYGGPGYPLANFFGLNGKKILRYHNTTPVFFFEPFLEKKTFENFQLNYQRMILEIYSLVKSVDFILCDSNFNLNSLYKIMNFVPKNSAVLPIVRNYPIIEKSKNTNYRLIFIGRWSPNKKLEDILFIFYYLNQINSNYKLTLIGKRNEIFNKYNDYLLDIIHTLHLSNFVELYENVNEDDRVKYLDNSDIFLCMSEHEGFCIPILESISRKCLIVSYAQEAIRETLKGSGILIRKKDFSKIAFLIDSIMNRVNLKENIIQKQIHTLNHFNNIDFQYNLKNAIGFRN